MPEHVAGRVKYLVCVDGSPQSRVAVRFACLRAKNTNGFVVLLTVIEPAEFQHWMAVEDVMKEERRDEAEHLLHDLAAEVNEWAGVIPVFTVREGHIGEVREPAGAVHFLHMSAAGGDLDTEPLSLRVGRGAELKGRKCLKTGTIRTT